MGLKDRIARIENKGDRSPKLIYFEDEQGKHAMPLLQFVLDEKIGGIKAVNYEHSKRAIGNGVLYSIGCMEKGFYSTDEHGNAVIRTE